MRYSGSKFPLKKKKILKLTAFPGCEGRRRPPALLTGCASRATGHPNGARVQVRRAGRASAAEPTVPRGPDRTGHPPRLAAPGTAPAGPRRGRLWGPVSAAPDSVQRSRTPTARRGGQSPAAPPATWVQPPGLDGPDAASARGSPATRAGPRTPDPHSGPRPGPAARDDHAAQTRGESGRSRPHSPASSAPQPAAAAAPALPHGLPEGPPPPSVAPSRLQGARASGARQPGRCSPAALRRLPPTRWPDSKAWCLDR